MSADAMSRLAAADPVTGTPSVEPPERLRRLIEDDAPTPMPGIESYERPGGHGRRAVAGVLFSGLTSAVVLLFGGGSSDRDLNVAAEAYAATSPQPGIVEAVFLARSFREGKLATLRQQEWLDATTGQRRELNTLDEPNGRRPFHQVTDWAFSRRLVEEWSLSPQRSLLRLKHLPASARLREVVLIQHTLANLKVHLAFRGIGMDGLEGIEMFRSLYRTGQMKLVGRARHGARELWRLESRVIVKHVRSGEPSTGESHTRLVLLVDPKTFLPVTEMQIDEGERGHPRVLVESNLLRYRQLAAGGPGLEIFDLVAQHPGARVIDVPPRFPKFIRMKARSGARGRPATPTHGRR
jgi:hypothetical protein